jgi:hypothetical protein
VVTAIATASENVVDGAQDFHSFLLVEITPVAVLVLVLVVLGDVQQIEIMRVSFRFLLNMEWASGIANHRSMFATIPPTTDPTA